MIVIKAVPKAEVLYGIDPEVGVVNTSPDHTARAAKPIRDRSASVLFRMDPRMERLISGESNGRQHHSGPRSELAAKNKAHFPNESREYRQSRNALLADEIELRRHIERVAALRRSLPPGGVVPEDYAFEGPNGAVRLSQLFGDKDTLVIYSMMFGPQRELACPMCTAMLTSWDGTARNLRERVALAATARSPIERLHDFKKNVAGRTCRCTPIPTATIPEPTSAPKMATSPASASSLAEMAQGRHFWSGEMSGERADPGQDPRGATDLDPLWTILELTPAGRGTTWYPKLEYDSLTTIEELRRIRLAASSHFGIGIDTALPAPRSAIQIVSPAGSTPVGVSSPSLITVTLALSPLTVSAEILPLPFSARKSLPFAARMPSGPFTGWSIQISTGVPGFPAASTGMR